MKSQPKPLKQKPTQKNTKKPKKEDITKNNKQSVTTAVTSTQHIYYTSTEPITYDGVGYSLCFETDGDEKKGVLLYNNMLEELTRLTELYKQLTIDMEEATDELLRLRQENTELKTKCRNG